MKSIIFTLLCFLTLTAWSQAPTFEEIEFEMDSTASTYKPIGKNFALIKSKRGTSGLTKTSKADSILTFPINEIVLVYSELSPDAISEREQANRERWENLLKTYPDLFQFSTTYKNVCQCNLKGDSAAFKKMQGFYVYFTPEEPKKPVVAVPAATPKTEPKAVKEEEKKEDPKPSKTEKDDSKALAKEKENEKKKEREREKELEKEAAATAKKEKENRKEKESEEKASKKEKESEEKVSKKEKEDDTPLVEGPETTLTISDADLTKSTVKKRTGYAKPKKAKDPKACRPACYGGGDEDLNTFFITNIPLTKKQKRHGKQLNAQLKLQLNFDGAIKKAFITGTNEDFNKLVMESIKQMDLWNPTVRNGVTVKSEIKLTLKYDRDAKGIVVAETALIPRLLPKCKCVSDAELFGE